MRRCVVLLTRTARVAPRSTVTADHGPGARSHCPAARCGTDPSGQPLTIRIRPRPVRAPRPRFPSGAPGADGRSRAAEFLAHRRIRVVGLRYPRVVREPDVDLV